MEGRLRSLGRFRRIQSWWNLLACFALSKILLVSTWIMLWQFELDLLTCHSDLNSKEIEHTCASVNLFVDVVICDFIGIYINSVWIVVVPNYWITSSYFSLRFWIRSQSQHASASVYVVISHSGVFCLSFMSRFELLDHTASVNMFVCWCSCFDFIGIFINSVINLDRGVSVWIRSSYLSLGFEFEDDPTYFSH